MSKENNNTRFQILLALIPVTGAITVALITEFNKYVIANKTAGSSSPAPAASSPATTANNQAPAGSSNPNPNPTNNPPPSPSNYLSFRTPSSSKSNDPPPAPKGNTIPAPANSPAPSQSSNRTSKSSSPTPAPSPSSESSSPTPAPSPTSESSSPTPAPSPTSESSSPTPTPSPTSEVSGNPTPSASSSPTPSESPAQENLVGDPSFEEQSSTSVTSPWTSASNSAAIELGTGKQYKGNNYALVSGNSEDPSISQVVNVKPNTTYKVSAYIQTSGNLNENDGYLAVKTNSSESEPKVINQVTFGSSSKYEERSFEFKSGENNQVLLSIGLFTPNKEVQVQIDDVSLAEVANNQSF